MARPLPPPLLMARPVVEDFFLRLPLGLQPKEYIRRMEWTLSMNYPVLKQNKRVLLYTFVINHSLYYFFLYIPSIYPFLPLVLMDLNPKTILQRKSFSWEDVTLLLRRSPVWLMNCCYTIGNIEQCIMYIVQHNLRQRVSNFTYRCLTAWMILECMYAWMNSYCGRKMWIYR